ncbi:dTDP-6-deoxy-L-hexose 3-O-methyltransferase [Escherichia coli]|uniref:dTDP-6-deoxy-L-hexose 3-O-methyltransferase n=1 Tax=Escherichia coli TaxID=562 RepID=UPI00215B329D|nr:dTDP-6-deoxy-L-hexose 3-O-methyltransferase [Escherichia coli]
MTTITRENAEIKSFITGFLSDSAHDNRSSNSLLANVFRIALASLEAEPVVYMWDSERKDIDAPGYYRAEHLVFAESSVKQWGGRVVPLYTAPPALVVPEFETWFNSQESGRSICSTQIRRSLQEISWNACRAAMLHAGNFREIPETSTNSPVTPTLLPGGFTVEDAKELHEDLVRSHISQALSGEKMKKKDRDADLRWIHGVIVQAAWFVKASLEALPEPPQEVNQ